MSKDHVQYRIMYLSVSTVSIKLIKATIKLLSITATIPAQGTYARYFFIAFRNYKFLRNNF